MSRLASYCITFLVTFLISFSSLADDLGPETQKLIDKKVEEKLQKYFNSKTFDKQVEQAIISFIEKQNRERARREGAAAEAGAKNVAAVNSKQDYIKGTPAAEFSLIEYSDFECPFCKRFHTTAGSFIKKYPEVNWVYRHFPLNFHNPGAQKQAEAAECAGALGGNKAFWEYSDAIYSRTRSNGKGFPIKNLTPLAVEIGLDRAKFEDCFNKETYKRKVLAQFQNGQRSGVNGTPGNFLRHNPSKITISIPGAQPLAKLESALEELKTRAKSRADGK